MKVMTNGPTYGHTNISNHVSFMTIVRPVLLVATFPIASFNVRYGRDDITSRTSLSHIILDI